MKMCNLLKKKVYLMAIINIGVGLMVYLRTNLQHRTIYITQYAFVNISKSSFIEINNLITTTVWGSAKAVHGLITPKRC